MQINPYGADAVRLALDLVVHPPETAPELAARCRAAGLVVDVPVAATDLAATRDFLADWLAVVDAADPPARAALLNTLLREASAHPRLTDHAGTGWHLHYRDPDLPLAGVLRALISVGTALHLAGRGMHRLDRCGSADCDRPFADVSRTGRQRYCSPGCANRDAVRRHRSRARSVDR
ncbi:CGNR zinc finger domain-containing protein [Micromonospora fluostatini]|uniref:CGNR zinc finger domain-containing protein n=1 Tax=Micromonospora sp. JCM 30529 TaxID=3421643 RepID=UPI003D16B7D1